MDAATLKQGIFVFVNEKLLFVCAQLVQLLLLNVKKLMFAVWNS